MRKGRLFLRTLEKAVGRDRFDTFLRSYFDRFAFRSITTADFTAYLKDHLLLGPDESKVIDLDAWLEGPGLPSGFAEPKSARLDAIDRTAKGWLDGTIPTDRIEVGDWSTHEWIRFLQAMPDKVPAAKLAELDRRFGLTDRGNSEIAHQWLLIAIRNDYAPATSRLKNYLMTIGRRKLVLPLYKAMLATPEGRAARGGDLCHRAARISPDHGRLDRQAPEGDEVNAGRSGPSAAEDRPRLSRSAGRDKVKGETFISIAWGAETMSREEEFERRLAALEQTVAELQRTLLDTHDPRAGLNNLIGSIKDPEGFEEVLRLGREYRYADRPKDEGDEES